MAQFTFIELHFEEGAIPAVEGLGATPGDDSTGETGGNEDTGGASFLKLVGAVVAVVALVVLVRRFLGGERALPDPDEALEDVDELVE